MMTSLKRASALFFAGLLALAGCSGDSGEAGPPGPQGQSGQPGQPGQITDAKLESCAGCHAGAGGSHQSVYDAYTDASRLAITIDDIATDTVASISTMTVSIAYDGQPYEDVAGLPGLSYFTFGSSRAAGPTFYATSFAAGKFNTTISYGNAKPTGTPGEYTVTATQQETDSVKSAIAFQPEVGPAIAFAYAFANPITFEAFQVYDDPRMTGGSSGRSPIPPPRTWRAARSATARRTRSTGIAWRPRRTSMTSPRARSATTTRATAATRLGSSSSTIPPRTPPRAA
jgi:hypothetical protein